jgi:hypothetical protein
VSKLVAKKTPVKPISKKVTTTPKPIVKASAPIKSSSSNSLSKIDIEKIFRELIRKEFARLGIILSEENEFENAEKKEDQEPELISEEIDDPMDIDVVDIDLVRLKNAKDLLPMEGRVEGNDVQILADTCANTSFLPESLVNELKLEVDTSKTQKLNGASGENRTLGVVRDLLIELAPGCIIKEDPVVLKDYPYREIGLSRACLRRYNYDVLESRGHIPLTCNGKNFFIPIVLDKNRDK